MNVTRIGLDLAKNVFQIHGVDRDERVVVKRKCTRRQVHDYFEKLPPCRVGMEACASAHYWAREFTRMGHEVKLIAPRQTLRQKPEERRNDAEAICEAVGRPNMRFVTVKTVAQQDMLAVHRIRSELVRQRTAKANQIRGLLAEYGVIVPVGISALRRALPEIHEEAENGLSGLFRRLLDGLQHGRDLSAWLGLPPAQHSSGGKDRLLGMSKRGDRYLRTLLIHGARSVIKTAANKTDPRSRWIVGVVARRHKNVAAVALANKNARIAWALIVQGGGYDKQFGMATA